MSHVNASISAAADKVSSSSSDDRQLAITKCSSHGTIEGSLQEVFELLGKIELGGKVPAPGWVPKFTGLERVSCDLGVRGASLWVLAEYKGVYAAGGEELQHKCEAVIQAGPSGMADVAALLETAKVKLAVSKEELRRYVASL